MFVSLFQVILKLLFLLGPHAESCLFRQILCHHEHFTSANGLSRLVLLQKRTNLHTHRRQNFSVGD